MDNDKVLLYDLKKLEEKVKSSNLPEKLSERALLMVQRLEFIIQGGNFAAEYESTTKYIDWIIDLPWNSSTKDILDLGHAKQVLDKTHYGLKEVKEKIYDYLSVMIMKNIRHAPDDIVNRAPIISLIGLAGTGKTTVAYSIAEALGRKIVRIPFGGMGGASLLRGQSRIFPDAEPGLIVKALRQAQVKNPIILLDEIDRISESFRSDIMGVLIELLDPEQNKSYTDHFIDYPFDLSNVFFITTANNTKNIVPAVLDRLEVIQMPSYTDQEKIVIGRDYMFPRIMSKDSLTAQDLSIKSDVWEIITRPLGFDPGIRTLQRTIESIVRRVARDILEGKIKPNSGFTITRENVKEFIFE